MPHRGALLPLCILLCGISALAWAAGDEVVLKASNQGHVFIQFPDQTIIEMGPAVLSREWAYTGAWAALMVEGNSEELFQAGQTTWLLVYNEGGRRLTVFAQLQPDQKDSQLLHFLYRFSAEQPVTFNSAYLELRLPVKPYAGEKLETIGGLKCEPAFTVEPPARDAHLANGSAEGVAVAGEAAHGFRLEVEPARWMCVNDERAWNKRNEFYTIQTCAIVTPAGTTLEPGQSAEVKGAIRFNAPVRVYQPAPIAPPSARVAATELRPDLTRPWLPCWNDGAGVRMFASHLTLRRPGGNVVPEVETTAPSAEPPGVTMTGKLFTDQPANVGFDVWQQAAVKPGEMAVQAKLTARSDLDWCGVALDTWLLRKYVEGCEAVFIGVPGGHSPAVVLRPDLPRVGAALATGIRLQVGGQTVFEVTAGKPAVWEIFNGGDGYAFCEWLQDCYPGFARPAAGSVIETSLTCRWGPQ